MAAAAERDGSAHLLIDLQLGDRPVVLVGGGAAALAKLTVLHAARVPVRLFAGRRPMPALAALAETGPAVQLERRLPEERDLGGHRLVIIALEDETQAARLAALAREAGALVNVVDRKALSDVHFPALVLRPPVQVAVSTGGRLPQLAALVRRRIEVLLPLRLGAFARRFAAVRARWRARGESTKSRRLALAARLERALADGDRPPEAAPGEVVLAGAGPGRADWLTLEAARLLALADVILHDGLVSPEVLSLARRDALVIDVSRRAGRDRAGALARATSLMIAHARRGRLVLRLKGGDPAIFAHTMEEVEALKAAGVRWRIVPGVTAASAAAAAAGIALTTRDGAQAVSFVTARRKGGACADLAGLARGDRSLVVYMGVGEAAAWAAQLMADGLAPATPVLVAERVGWPGERRLVATLGTLAAAVAGNGVASPALFVVGAPAAAARATAETGTDAAAVQEGAIAS